MSSATEQNRDGLRPAEGTELEADHEALVRGMAVGVCVIDRRLRFLRANPSFLRMVARELDEVLGAPMDEVLPPSVGAGALALARQVLQHGEPVLGVEVRALGPCEPGVETIWLANIHPVIVDGEVAGVMAVLQDITSLRRAEERSRESLLELESVYRGSPVGLSYIDRDLRYLRVNQVIADANGVPIEDVVGRTYRELSPANADEAEPLLRRIMERGEPVRNLRTRARPPADPDVEHTYLLSCEPVRGADGEVAGLVTSVLDITELEQAEQEARRAQERIRDQLAELEILHRNAPVGLVRLDLRLRVVSGNPLFASLVDRPASELLGLPLDEVLPEDMAKQVVPNLRRVLMTGHPGVDVRIRGSLADRPLDEDAWILRAHPIKGEGGGVTGVIAVLQDISPLVHQQKELESLLTRLSEAQQVSKLGSWEWNLVEDRVWWSDELFDLFGHDPATVRPTYNLLFEAVHPDDRQELRQQAERTLSSDLPCWVPFRILRRDGSERRFLTAMRLERGDGGQPLRLVGTCQDVSDSFVGARRP